MKSWLKVICLLSVAVMVGSCAKKEQIKIGVSVATMQEAVYTFMKQAMLDNIEKDGVKLIWLSADNKESNQISNVENLITQQVDVLILHAVNTAAAAGLVKKAKDDGIPVVAMDRLPVGTDLECYVTANSFKVGQEQAKYLAEKIGGKGNVIICQGEAGNTVAQEITAGNYDILKKYPKIEIVVNQTHQGWARDLAMATVENALTRYKNNIQGILCNNSGMAMGAVQALLAQKLTDKVVIIGSDADKDACQSIIEGNLDADVDKMPYELGLVSYKIALALVKGESFDYDKKIDNAGIKVKVKFTSIKLVTKKNIKDMKNRWPDLKF